MVEDSNPFTPSFGEIPAHMAGRRQIIADITRALESSRRRLELTSLFSGARGTGKTALLSLLASEAQARGWVVASTTAVPGMLDDIELAALSSARHLIDRQPTTRLSSIAIPQIIEVGLQQTSPVETNWRFRMNTLLDQLDQSGTGLLITVDEVDVELPEMVQLAAVYQHFIRENRKVALFMAGLPHNVSALLNNKSVSFLRRASLIDLGRIDDDEIEAALETTVREAGRSIKEADIQHAAAAIQGFPFLMQLVGYRMWDANPESPFISASDVDYGIRLARKEMTRRILEATYRDLSEGDVRFLNAMLEDDDTSRMADIAERMGVSASLASQYRRRLIDAGVIGSRTRGVVGFDMPFFREYLKELSE